MPVYSGSTILVGKALHHHWPALASERLFCLPVLSLKIHVGVNGAETVILLWQGGTASPNHSSDDMKTQEIWEVWHDGTCVVYLWCALAVAEHVLTIITEPIEMLQVPFCTGLLSFRQYLVWTWLQSCKLCQVNGWLLTLISAELRGSSKINQQVKPETDKYWNQ